MNMWNRVISDGSLGVRPINFQDIQAMLVGSDAGVISDADVRAFLVIDLATEPDVWTDFQKILGQYQGYPDNWQKARYLIVASAAFLWAEKTNRGGGGRYGTTATESVWRTYLGITAT